LEWLEKKKQVRKTICYMNAIGTNVSASTPQAKVEVLSFDNGNSKLRIKCFDKKN
jgi:hypothetical protein